MKKLLFILCFLSFNCLGGTPNICTTDEVVKFSNEARSEIASKTYYPKKAQMKGIEGTGNVVVFFDGTWSVVSKEIQQSTGSEHLDIAMIDAIKSSNFLKPNCAPVMPVRITAPFIFKLQHFENNSPAPTEIAE
jgi:TonB family protein